jgi:DNA-binding CsgD family transcriptional regulator
VRANAAGQDMLYQRDHLRLSGSRLQARDPQINQALHKTFSAAANAGGDVVARTIPLPLVTHSGERYVAHVLPLTSGQRRSAKVDDAAVAAMFVRKVALESAHCPEVIARTYKLTMAELRVLLAIVEAGNVSETAEALGVAETTVKTHLHRLFVKTNTKRQADLVKIVAGFSSPLANRSPRGGSS